MDEFSRKKSSSCLGNLPLDVKSRINLKTTLRLTIQVVLSNVANGEALVLKSAARVVSVALVMVTTMVMGRLRMVTVHRQLLTLLTTQLSLIDVPFLYQPHHHLSLNVRYHRTPIHWRTKNIKLFLKIQKQP